MEMRFTGANGAVYTVCDEASEPTTRGKPHVHVTHAQHEARVIVGGYNGARFDGIESARAWALSDSHYRINPGEPIFKREFIG